MVLRVLFNAHFSQVVYLLTVDIIGMATDNLDEIFAHKMDERKWNYSTCHFYFCKSFRRLIFSFLRDKRELSFIV